LIQPNPNRILGYAILLYSYPYVNNFLHEAASPNSADSNKIISPDSAYFISTIQGHAYTVRCLGILKGEPKETEVFGILGLPDSVWVADSQKYKVLYYFIESLDDYNSVEIDITSKKVNGFEWD